MNLLKLIKRSVYICVCASTRTHMQVGIGGVLKSSPRKKKKKDFWSDFRSESG